jgi:hypothetical protein
MISQDTQYLFQPGDTVLLNTGLRHFLKVDAAFVIVARLPPLGTELQYRIKSVKEPYERVVLEHQIMAEQVEAVLEG